MSRHHVFEREVKQRSTAIFWGGVGLIPDKVERDVRWRTTVFPCAVKTAVVNVDEKKNENNAEKRCHIRCDMVKFQVGARNSQNTSSTGTHVPPSGETK